jgi:peptide/nickel transport system substrate-binding protein
VHLRSGNRPGSVAVANGKVWVANGVDDSLRCIDPADPAPCDVLHVPGGIGGLIASDDSLWATSEFGNDLLHVELTADGKAVSTRIPLGGSARALTMSDGLLWVGSGHGPFAAQRGGLLRVVGGANIRTADPALADGVPQLMSLVGDGLVAHKHVDGVEGYDLVPDLGSTLPSPTHEMSSFRFTLRPNVHYSDGRLVQPRDFRRGIERAVTMNPVASREFAAIRGMETCRRTASTCDLSKGIVTSAAKRTVIFRLTGPDPDFLFKLAKSWAYPVPPGVSSVQTDTIPGTGPYRIESLRPSISIRLVRNRHFRVWSHVAKPDGYPDSIDWQLEGSPEKKIDDLDRDRADIYLEGVSPDRLPEVRSRGSNILYKNTGRFIFIIGLNLRSNRPFRATAARQALNLAIDRNAILDDLGGSDAGTVTCQAIPDNAFGRERYCPADIAKDGGKAYRGPNLHKAKQLVRESGTHGAHVSIVIPESKAGVFYHVALRVERTLKALGYRVTHAPGWGADVRVELLHSLFPTPRGALALLRCDANGDVGGFCSPAIDKQIEGVRQKSPRAGRKMWEVIDRQISDAAPWIPVLDGTQWSLIGRRVSNYRYNPVLGVLLDQLSVV